MVESQRIATADDGNRPGDREVGRVDGRGGRTVRPPCPIFANAPAEESCGEDLRDEDC